MISKKVFLNGEDKVSQNNSRVLLTHDFALTFDQADLDYDLSQMVHHRLQVGIRIVTDAGVPNCGVVNSLPKSRCWQFTSVFTKQCMQRGLFPFIFYIYILF